MHLLLQEWFPLLCIFWLPLFASLFSVLISALTQGAEGDHLFMFTCSVMLWGGRNTANKYHWHVWGVLTVYGPHWVCLSSPWCVLSRSTLFRLQVALQGNCPKVGPAFRALSWFKLLKFRFLGTPQRHRLGWREFCVLPRSEQLR